MKKIISFVFAALFLVPSVSFGKIGTRNLEEELKHEIICMPGPVTGTSTAGAGLDGVIFATTINGVSAPTSTASNAGAPSTFSWPAKLTVDLLDSAASADTLTCASVVIKGTDQFGKAISETISSLTETAQTTTNVFSTVSSVVGATCAGASDAGDKLIVYQSQELGLTRRITALSDIESACIADLSDSSSVKCARADTGGDDDLDAAIELASHSVDVSTTVFGVDTATTAAAADDTVCFRIRSSWRAN